MGTHRATEGWIKVTYKGTEVTGRGGRHKKQSAGWSACLVFAVLMITVPVGSLGTVFYYLMVM